MNQDTSREALEKAPNRYEQVEALFATGDRTDWEMHLILDCPYSAIQRPRGQLVEEGKIQDSGRRRQTGYGRNAIVWELVAA